MILPVAAAVATLIRPSMWRAFTDGAVARYALTAQGWLQLRSTAPLPVRGYRLSLKPRWEGSKPSRS